MTRWQQLLETVPEDLRAKAEAWGTAYDAHTGHQFTQTALCIWEEILSHMQDGADTRWERLRANVGTSAIRTEVPRLVMPCELAWHIGHNPDAFQGAFDWEFVPAFLETCVEVTDMGISLREGWLDLMITRLALNPL